MEDKAPKFKTHIAEPRWQQIVSVVIVLIAIAAWLYLSVIKH